MRGLRYLTVPALLVLCFAGIAQSSTSEEQSKDPYLTGDAGKTGMAEGDLKLLVGTYTEGTGSRGIYLYSYSPEYAGMTLIDTVVSGNPSFVIAPQGGDLVYSVNEFGDGRQGVSAFRLADGKEIVPVNSAVIGKKIVDGEDPCNLLYTGGAIVSSNYTGGSVSVFGIEADGSIGEMTQWYEGGMGESHMHCAVLSPDGKYIFVTDLGRDQIHRFRRGEGTLPLGEHTVAWSEESKTHFGPRHLTFSPDGRRAYLISELADKLTVFSYYDGLLTPVQTLTAYNGKGGGSADIHISPDGWYLYTSHRLKKDGIAIFHIRPDGTVEKKGYQPTGRHPRNFAISPDGHYLLCACRDDNRIEIYRINETSGLLSLYSILPLPSPVCIEFVR